MDYSSHSNPGYEMRDNRSKSQNDPYRTFTLKAFQEPREEDMHSGAAAASPGVRSLFRERNTGPSQNGPRGGIPAAQSMPYNYNQNGPNHQDIRSVFSDDEHWITRTASGGLLMKNTAPMFPPKPPSNPNKVQKKPNRGAGHWIKKKVLGMDDPDTRKLTPIQIMRKKNELCEMLERSAEDQEGTKTIMTYTGDAQRYQHINSREQIKDVARATITQNPQPFQYPEERKVLAPVRTKASPYAIVPPPQQPRTMELSHSTTSYIGASPSYDVADSGVKCEELLIFDYDNAIQREKSTIVSPNSVMGRAHSYRA